MISSRFEPGSKDLDEGASCLRIIIRHYSKHGGIDDPKAFTGALRSLSSIARAAEKIGFRGRHLMLTYDQLRKDVALPCIIQLGEERLMVLFRQSRWRGDRRIKCTDPAGSTVAYSRDEFLLNWIREAESGKKKGPVLLLEPTSRFRAKNEARNGKLTWRVMLQYFRHHHWQIGGVVITFLITSLVQLIFPFLVQSIVDVGINSQDLSYVSIILIAQSVLVISRITVDFIRSLLLLQISSVFNLFILSDFWIKLARLPLAFFDQHRSGDIMQRITDNRQLRNFITGPAINIFFSAFNFIVFAIVLVMYKLQLFLIFGAGVVLYYVWMHAFFKIRKKINYRIFQASARENSATLEFIQGMQEIRLHDIEQPKRWEWESIQADLFYHNSTILKYGQVQRAGATLINYGKDMMLTFLVAKLVMEGKLTLGAMFAIEYIIGQLSGPVEQFIGFFQNAQDAKISMDRLNEIHDMEDEEKASESYVRSLPSKRTIRFENLSFTYPGEMNGPVLSNIELEIPEGKTTAIVGPSGSGKTTLLKLLLKFYMQYDGVIKIGDVDFKAISPSYWRGHCGAVLQDGYIFSATISHNIVLGHEPPDPMRLREACELANILSFIEALPDGFDTRIGGDGMGISQGQKQRLLIARAVYKNPSYLFFDESTNALDSDNETVIVGNLQAFFKDRTVIVVAHRLSTVRNADNIIVLNGGFIVEQGEHHGLTRLRGKYFELVKNQLDLA